MEPTRVQYSMARPRNLTCNSKATVLPFCAIQLHVNVNNKKVLIVAQQCFYVVGNKEMYLGLNVKCPNFCLFLAKFGFHLQILMLSVQCQFSPKSASDSRADTC
jgi:hypothetical protein